MKILQVIHAFAPAWDYGGSLRVCYEISRELAGRGHDVTVLTTDTLNAKERVKVREETIDGIKVKRFRVISNSMAYHHHIFLPPAMLPAIRKQVRDSDIVHLHEYRTLHNLAVHHYARKFQVPYILQAHGAVPRFAAKLRLKRLFDTLWGVRLLKDARGVFALSETEAERYAGMGVEPSRVHILPNGIDLSEFDDLPPRETFRERYGLASDDIVVLYLGRIHRTKGIDLLVRAFAGLAGEVDKMKLVIVGPDDGFQADITELARSLGIGDKLVFTGPVYGRDRLAAYVSADVFVTPSFSGFPVTFLEACACGTPVVTTRNGDRLEWLHDKVGLVTEYTENDLKQAIVAIVQNPDLARRLGEAGKQVVREQFNWTKITDEIERIYEAAAAAPAGSA